MAALMLKSNSNRSVSAGRPCFFVERPSKRVTKNERLSRTPNTAIWNQHFKGLPRNSNVLLDCDSPLMKT